MDKLLHDRTEAFGLIKDNLKLAQQQIKYYANRHQTYRNFKEGDYVYLKLQLYSQSTVAIWKNLKLAPRYFGPIFFYSREGCTGRLSSSIPNNCLLHPVFHVLQLKIKLAPTILVSSQLPSTD